MFSELFDLSFVARYLHEFYFWLKMTEIGRLVSAILIFLFALMIRSLFSFFAIKILNFLILKKITYSQERFIREISKPIEFIPVVFGFYFAIDVLKVPPYLLYYTRNFLSSLYIFTFTWIIYSFVNPLAFVFKKSHLDNTKTVIITWIVRITKFLIIVIGLSALLEKWGVKVSTLIASLGLVGMAVALGAQDMFRNIISGIAIISEHRFSVGDIVKIEDVDRPIEGVVENIGFRSTMIRKFDRAPLFVPNSTLADAAVINFSSRMYRRIEWIINIDLRATSDQLKYVRQEIERYLIESDNFVKPPESALQVRLDRIGNYSIELLIYCFVSTNVWTEWLKIKEELILKIKQVVEEAGVSLAYPSSSVYVKKVDKDMKLNNLSNNLKNKVKKGNKKDQDVFSLDVREGDI